MDQLRANASGLASCSVLNAEGQTAARTTPERPQVSEFDRSEMSVLVFIVLTVVIFALLGLIQKLVEGL